MEIIKFSTALKLYPQMLIESPKDGKKESLSLLGSKMDDKVFPVIYNVSDEVENGNHRETSITIGLLNPSDVEIIDQRYRLAIYVSVKTNDLGGFHLINQNSISLSEAMGKKLFIK